MAEQKPGYCWNCDHEVTVHVDEAAGDVHCTSCEGSCVEVREPEQVIHHGVMCDRSGMNPIRGTRYHKRGENYDLCEDEFRKLPVEEQALYEAIERPSGGAMHAQTSDGLPSSAILSAANGLLGQLIQQHQAGEGVESDTRSRANQPMLAVISNLLQSMLAQAEGGAAVGFGGFGDFDAIVSHLMANDPNSYGSPPASKAAVAQLERTIVGAHAQTSNSQQCEEPCCVCKDEMAPAEEVLKMPCGHYMHTECILPWLERHNSCPSCRFELPTDDRDYEETKRRMQSQLDAAAQSRSQ